MQKIAQFRYRRKLWRVYAASQQELRKEMEAAKEDGAIHGVCDSDNRRIMIWDRLRGRKRASALLHEFLHMIVDAQKLNLPHPLMYVLDCELGRVVGVLNRVCRKGPQ